MFNSYLFLKSVEQGPKEKKGKESDTGVALIDSRRMDMLLSDSDSETFTESSSSEDLDDMESLYGGRAQCILSSLEKSIHKIDDFLSFERGFIHGDVVRSITNPSGQLGKVIGIEMLVDLENVYGKIIRDVNSKKISKIRSLSVGDYVVHGAWLGQIFKIVDRLTLLFDDGSKCEFLAVDGNMIFPVSPDLLEDSQYPYYPGQRVQIKLSTISKSAQWLCGIVKENRNEGTICKVEPGVVYVDWVASALNDSALRFPIPSRLQDSKSLTQLACFSYANWQLGDWCILGSPDVFHKKSERWSKKRDYDEIYTIVKIKMKVDVLWQDGNCSLGLDSQLLFPINIDNAHDFWPGQFVKATSDELCLAGGQRFGVVINADADERTVRVEWRKKEGELEGYPVEETASAYELIEHPEYSYCIGDLILKVDKNCEINKEFQSECYLSSIGYVIGFKDGYIDVRWASGMSTKVAPDEIVRLDKHEGSTANTVHNVETVGESNQELIGHEKESSEESKEVLETGVDKDYKYSLASTSFSLPQAAIGFFSNLALSLFGSIGTISNPSRSPMSLDPVGENQPCLPKEIETSSTVGGDYEVFGETSMHQQVEEMEEQKDIKINSSGCEKPESFKQFDIVSGCSDHHFVDGVNKALGFPQVGTGWAKKVQQEWGILEKNLPETIYVRIYEERMDLLRAAIVGAHGTPYHDALFFFDILLPPEYPQKPPVVHYISGGLRVNPNLYETGKVCLSLLNTWTGTGTEVWKPESSTVLQVLLSLQALVLNEKPYFNEAGYDKQMGRADGERNSGSYNENAFLVTCKSMLYLLRRPPKHFEELVDEHFNQRSRNILLACKDYMRGTPVGCAFENWKNDSEKGSSTGFKLMLAKLYPQLVEAFSEKGIDCSQFIEAEK